MKYGVIDIGSNTIKAFVYDSEDNYSVIDSMHCATKLINYIDGGIMSEEGINTAIRDITSLKEFLIEKNCDEIFSYATSATRDCENCSEIIQKINSACGLCVDVLSGKAEALCDAKGATLLGMDDFLCVDLGGGSAQVCEYKNGELFSAVSRPIGALRIKKTLNGTDFPDEILEEKTVSLIKEYIAGIKPSKEGLPAIIMGGASQSCKKIMGLVGIDADTAYREVFYDVYRNLSAKPYEDRMAILRENVPLRAEILGYALLILHTILSELEANDVIFTQKGSREGYLLYKLEDTDFSQFV